MLRKLNVVLHFYVLEKHYANCKTTKSITRKITDVFQRTSEEKGERSEEHEKERKETVTRIKEEEEEEEEEEVEQ